MAKKKKVEDIGHNSSDRIKQYVERLERLDEQKEAINDDVKQVKAEIKSEGFDTKIIALLVKARKDEKQARETMVQLQTYAAAIQLDLF